MAEDGVAAFWRDDAKLWVHVRGERLKVLFVALIGLVATAIGVFVVGKAVSLPNDAAGILSVAGTAITALAVFSTDLYFKGGKAGSELKALHTAAVQTMESQREDSNLRRPELSDVQEELTILFMQCPAYHAPDDLYRNFGEFNVWFAATISRLRELLRTSKVEMFYRAAQPFIDGEFSQITSRTLSAFSACRRWLDTARREVSEADINPDCRMPSRAFVASSESCLETLSVAPKPPAGMAF
jgi:hypothetical protein